MSHGFVQPPHLLLIDDDPDQLRLLVAALRDTSYRISVALNGDQGYARAAVLLPDLILLDMRMPGRNGVTVARLLKSNPATQHIPVLFLSAAAEKDERLTGLRAGAVDFIAKTSHAEEVLERVRIHLGLSRNPPRATFGKALAESAHDHSPPLPLTANATLKQLAMEFVLNHLHDPSLTSAGVASSLGMSLRRLNSLFASTGGTSVFEFIRQERMQRAAQMIAQSTLTIADIGMEVGYANPANFSTEFKKFWGSSPRQFRRDPEPDAESSRLGDA